MDTFDWSSFFLGLIASMVFMFLCVLLISYGSLHKEKTFIESCQNTGNFVTSENEVIIECSLK